MHRKVSNYITFNLKCELLPNAFCLSKQCVYLNLLGLQMNTDRAHLEELFVAKTNLCTVVSNRQRADQ